MSHLMTWSVTFFLSFWLRRPISWHDQWLFFLSLFGLGRSEPMYWLGGVIAPLKKWKTGIISKFSSYLHLNTTLCTQKASTPPPICSSFATGLRSFVFVLALLIYNTRTAKCLLVLLFFLKKTSSVTRPNGSCLAVVKLPWQTGVATSHSS